MARIVKDAALDSRKGRDKLTSGKRHWRNIRTGLALGYYKATSGGGAWLVRWQMPDGRYTIKTLGVTDDHQDANGMDVFSFGQACAKAYEYAEQAAHLEEPAQVQYTVADCIAEYLAWYAAHRKALRDTQRVCEAHILPALGRYRLDELTTAAIRKWHEGLAKAPARLRTKAGAEQQAVRETNDLRARQATANRVLTVLKAALNRAFGDGKITDDTAWRKVRPFAKVDAPRIRYLVRDEVVRLLNACDPDMRELATGALQTGCRYGELIALKVEDFDPDAGTIFIRTSKSGRPRHAYLTDEGRQFFARLTLGKRRADLTFLRNGRPWHPAEQKRPIKQAAEAVGLVDVSFHILRHTYGTFLAQAGVPLQVIAEALGHADTRITSRHYAHLMPSYVKDTIRAALPAFGVAPGKVVPLRPRQSA